jgi:hypothetical protein
MQHFETWELAFLAVMWVVAWGLIFRTYWPQMGQRPERETPAERAERQFDEFQ